MFGGNLKKIITLVELLSKPDGATINELKEKLNIHRRSVYRWLDIAQNLGFPVYNEKVPLEKEVRWKLEETYVKKLPNLKMPEINLNLSEIISLYFIKSGAKIFDGTEIGRQIEFAYKKLDSFIPEKALKNLNNIKALFISKSNFQKDYSDKEEIIETLTDALLKKETCYVKYHSFYDDQIKNFKIDPLNFFVNDDGLYLIANTTSFGDIRVLAVERIIDLSSTGELFTYPENFDSEEYIDSSFDLVHEDPVKVKIWFHSNQARYIKERKWSKTQKIKDLDDGSIILSMETSGRWDVVRWVLSYGSEAKLIYPDDLKILVKVEIDRMKKIYLTEGEL